MVPAEGHTFRVVGIARLCQQGPVDLGGRRLGVGVDDEVPGRDVAVQIKRLQDQRDVSTLVALSDAVGLLLRCQERGSLGLAQPDPVRILRDLNEARPLGDIAYDIREREAQGWDGPKVTKWGKAADDAAKLLEGRQP